MHPAVSVVCPCFNEEESINELYRRLTDACASVASDSYEIILVNDGSKDLTWERMSALALADRKLVAINLSRNHGHQLALSAGLHVCKGERIFILDGDLQDPPELLPQMMARMDAGADVVYGQRRKREGETVFKKASSKIFYRMLAHLTEMAIPLDAGDFRLMSRRALNVVNNMPEQNRFVRGMISWVGFRQEPFLYDRAPRFAGLSKYPFARMVGFAVDAITSFSVRPLRLASYLGLIFGVLGLLTLGYVFNSWFQGQTIQGWTSLIAVILVLGSCQLLVAGITGEYIGRMYLEAKRRPLFIIQDIINGPVIFPPDPDR